jgi:hypothetical protein
MFSFEIRIEIQLESVNTQVSLKLVPRSFQ